MTSGSVNILHQQFTGFTGSTFNVLHSDQEFTDVTLVCDEDKQMKAHKVILSSSSKLFRRILLRNPHKHPLIYLKGVSYDSLQFIIQFIYLGQIDLPSEHLPSFIETARELEVNGLADVIFANDDSITEFKDVNTEDHMNNTETETKADMPEIVFLQNEDVPIIVDQSDIDPKTFKCDQCTLTVQGKSDLKKHIRTIHEGVSYPITNAERTRRYRERRRSLFSEETLRDMRKSENQRKNEEIKAKRMEDESFDQRFKKENRERKRRFREKKALEEALAKKMNNTCL